MKPEPYVHIHVIALRWTFICSVVSRDPWPVARLKAQSGSLKQFKLLSPGIEKRPCKLSFSSDGLFAEMYRYQWRIYRRS
jgi:hypothetical protein